MTGNTSTAMFTLENLKTRFGVSDNNPRHYHTLLMNGDAQACGAHVASAAWYGNTVMAVFETSVNGAIRINYMVVYTPNEIDGE